MSNKRSRGSLEHIIDLNTDTVNLKIYDFGYSPRITLTLDKQLDVNDSVKKRLDEIHKAIEVIAKGINDEYVEVSSI